MDELKNNTIIRILLIIIIGTIAFGLIFSLLTGGVNMEHMGQANSMGGYGMQGYGMQGYSYGSSLDTFLGGLLVLLFKLLMVVLVVAVVVGIGVWIKNTFFKNANTSKVLQTVNNDPILKTVSVITIAIIAGIFLFAVLGSFTGQGYGMGYGAGHSMGDYSGMAGGFSASLSIAGLLGILIKVLSFILVISLILALVAYVKKQYDQGAFNALKTKTHSETSIIVSPEDVGTKNND